VLVGGFGTRLRPLTLTVPKQMLPVCGVSMLERVVARLGGYGIDEVVLSLGYRPGVFAAAYPDGTCAGVQLRYAVEPEPLDTAGAIAFAAREAAFDETFLALNGDVLTDMALDELLDHHRVSGAKATISLTPVDDPSRYGVVPTAEDGRVLDGTSSPSSPVSRPCTLCSPRPIGSMPARPTPTSRPTWTCWTGVAAQPSTASTRRRRCRVTPPSDARCSDLTSSSRPERSSSTRCSWTASGCILTPGSTVRSSAAPR
jgi:hypothetical protein